MSTSTTTSHRGWMICITAHQQHCSNYSFTITSPTGHPQQVTMAGDSRERAEERAREMIDMEIALEENS